MVLGKGDALAGCVVSTKGNLPEAVSSMKLKYNLFPEIFGTGSAVKVELIKISEMLMLSIDSTMSVGVVKKIDKQGIELSLKIPIVPFKGNNVAIARNYANHWRLIGYGEII